ncbi:Isoprenylcysteine carboxyl methyltransferase family-domain-containing protein, partial [Scheffersomyces amazonensis]|uniref:Isoprenylcysteine carboxyl methyltransferase family-domain-containing protein n=1 Tax=Scheffersomyces amazonensis TaxID=1078765 RepID=UPI00315D2177
YLLSLITYFILEFCNTYRYQTSKVTSRSFLIYGNKGNFEFWLCQLFTICEFLIELKRSFGFETYVPPEFINSIIRIIGFCMIILGLYIRSLAMKTCGESFSHYIHTDDNNQPKLITHGIYAYLRHPSYFGFWWFSIGIQVFLRNPISLVLSIIVLRSFFTTRIKFEEYFLIQKIFGIDYIKYKQRVGIWIPLV